MRQVGIVASFAVANAQLPPAQLPSKIIGYYSWNWGSGSQGPSGANAACAFTGLIDVQNAIDQYADDASWCCPPLHGMKFLTLGGGNAAGTFTASALNNIIRDVDKIRASGYPAVMLDVEEVDGPSSTMVPLFVKTTAALKQAGLIVGITTSHSAPYQCDSAADAVAITQAWAADENIDILSPQLYSSGRESEPEFAETNSCKDAGCTWDLYGGAKAMFVPSIVAETQYSSVKSWFAQNHGIDVNGFFEWQQRAGESTVV